MAPHPLVGGAVCVAVGAMGGVFAIKYQQWKLFVHSKTGEDITPQLAWERRQEFARYCAFKL